MVSKKQKNRTAKASKGDAVMGESVTAVTTKQKPAKVKAPKGDAVKQETAAVTTKTKNLKRQSTEASQAAPAKVQKKEEPVSSSFAKSKKRKNRKKATNAAKKPAAAPGTIVGRQKAPTDEAKETTKKECAITYLKQWQEDRKNWKFKKLTQMWLNENVLNNVMVPDDSFPIWIDYMNGAANNQKLYVVKMATKALKELEAVNSSVDAKDVKYQRAKKIIQSLDDGDKKEKEDDDDDDDDDDDGGGDDDSDDGDGDGNDDASSS